MRLVAFASLACAAGSAPTTYVSLDSRAGVAAWRLRNANASIDVAATAPGHANLDLLRAGLVNEPYAGNNVDAQHWVAAEPVWTFAAAFATDASLAQHKVVELVADGVDAVAAVSLNGAPLWSQTSAFVRTVVDVTAVLKAPGSGSNSLEVAIQSPLAASAASFAACGSPGSGEFCPEPSKDGNGTAVFQGFNYIRKPPSSFGWDFAPNFAPSGVWRSIALRGYDDAVADEVTVVTTPLAPVARGAAVGPWQAVFTVYATSASAAVPVDVSITVEGAGPGGSDAVGQASAVLTKGFGNAINVTLQVEGVRAWWPAGLGEPALYRTTASLTVNATGETSALRTFPLGFRSVALHTPAAPDNQGSLYFFSVNGDEHPFFVKGANWVPNDAFAPRAAEAENFEPKVRSFVAGGYNALRVWGGGHPMADAFYEVAAAHGLFLWHEMPFACAEVPTDERTKADAALEARHISLRLQKYPLLVWGGNNEIAQIHNPSHGEAANYSLIFFKAIRDSLMAIDASRSYLASSPGSSKETADSPIASPVQQPALGDMHVYEYDGDCWDHDLYPSPRAASEYGWQSYSGLPSLAELIAPSQWSYWSDQIIRRDTHPSQPPITILFKNIGQNWRVPGYDVRGPSPLNPAARTQRLAGRALAVATAARAANATSISYTRRADESYALPTDALGLPAMLEGAPGGLANGSVWWSQMWMSQISHAACLSTEAEHYRRSQSQADGGGGGLMVSLFWMAADFWPAATKGAVEWNGRWKATQYAAARRFHAPFIVSAAMRPLNTTGLSPQQTPLSVWISAHPPASDLAIPSGLVEITCWSWSQGAILGRVDAPFVVTDWPAWPPTSDTASGNGALTASASGSSAGGSRSVYNSTLAATLGACGAASSPLSDVVISVVAFNGSSNSAPELARNWLYLSRMNAVTTMRDPRLSVVDVAAVAGAPGSFDVTIAADVLPVAAVWVESLLCCGFFSDNAFLLVESPTVLRYTANADARGWAHAPPPGSELRVTEGQFAASLSIWSLVDSANYGT